MVGPRLASYVESCGLDAEDVPKVIGTFVSVKYSTWLASVVLGVRCQPLRRLMLTRSQALPGGGGLAALRPWALVQRRWLLEAWERAARHHPGASRRVAVRQAASGPAAAPIAAAAPRAQRLGAQLGDALAAARTQCRSAHASYRDVKGKWHTAGRKLLSRQQLQLIRLREQLQQRALQHRAAGLTWHAWASARYWQLSDKLETAVSSSRACRALSSNFRIDPKGLALGLAEGTILYKSTVWLHVPLQLWLVMQFFRRRRSAVLLDDAAGPALGKGSESEGFVHMLGI